MQRLDPFPYRIEVMYSQDDGCYIARVPTLRGCSARGADWLSRRYSAPWQPVTSGRRSPHTPRHEGDAAARQS